MILRNIHHLNILRMLIECDIDYAEAILAIAAIAMSYHWDTLRYEYNCCR